HCTFVAPSSRKILTTCRHAAMYSAFVLPLIPGLHGYQLPFISCAKRKYIGWPQARAFRAHWRMYASYLPTMIIFSAYADCNGPAVQSHGSQVTSGTAPRV